MIEDILRREEIPYQVIGGLRFYERKEIKDVLAYLRVLINPEDSVSLRRIVNVPARGIGKTSLEKVEKFCMGKDLTLFESLRHASGISVSKTFKYTAPYSSHKKRRMLFSFQKRTWYFFFLRERFSSSVEEWSRRFVCMFAC